MNSLKCREHIEKVVEAIVGGGSLDEVAIVRDVSHFVS